MNDLTGTFISSLAIGDLRGGRYRLERKLAQGAFGAVYLAQDTELKRQVAVKVPRPEALAKLGNVTLPVCSGTHRTVTSHS